MEQKDSGNTLQALWLGLGSLSSFAFSIVSAAILSRFLLKSDYGTYKQVMYVYNTMLVVFTLGLPKAYAYFLPRVRREEGNHVVNKLNICFFLLGALFSILLYFLSPVIASFLCNPELCKCLKIFSPAPLFLLPTMGLEGIMSTYRMTKYCTLYMVFSRIFMLLCVVLPVVFYKENTYVALYGFTVSSFLSCLLALYIKKLPFQNVQCVKSILTYKQIFAFSIPLMSASIWAILIKSADQFFISRWFGEETFAEFSNGSLELPFVQMVLSAGGTVLLPLFSHSVAEGCDKKEIVDLWLRVTEKSSYIIYPLVVYCWTFAPHIMSFLYGDQYVASSIYFRIMLIINFFTIAQYYPIIVALGATKYYAKVHMLCALLVWLFEYICVIILSSPYAVTCVSVLCNFFKIFLMVRFISCYMEVKPWRLFPIKKLALIIITTSFSSVVVYLLNGYILSFNLKLLTLIYTFSFFLILSFVIGRFFSINYLSVIDPILKKIFRK